MIRYSKRPLYAILICFAAVVHLHAQQDLLNYDNSLKFARYLQRTQQYDFAAQEYERLNYLWPDDTTIILELVTNYRLNHDCSQFENAYELISKENRLLDHPAFAKEYLRFCLTCKREHPLYHPITATLNDTEKGFYTLGYYWANQQYDSAFAMVNSESFSVDPSPLFTLTREFEQEKYKKPALALALSAVIPGSGKAYSKRWGDAAISFIFVSSSAFASYRAFKKKGVKSVNGWLFGGVAFSFYASNLYGSFKAARGYNDDLRMEYHQHAETIIHRSY
jgi:hypothetical protein